ncbi:MAG: bifunctional NAD(P)/FAD-dependent oxidoreductase/class I SAM-dependent methyltransferase [Microthrixaceae bacterium]
MNSNAPHENQDADQHAGQDNAAREHHPADQEHATHNNHAPHNLERHCDVAIIGGSAAGLAAALQLGRQRRSVIVIDAGEPRNAPASHMHSFLGHEGLPPSELTAIGREEVRSYGGEVISGRAIEVTRAEDGDRFRVQLTGGTTVYARRVLAASGVVDELPDIDGLAEHWGTDVLVCPFCHGYEVRDRRIVQIVTHPMGLHPAMLFRHLSERFTIVLHDGVDADNPEVKTLQRAGVKIIDEKVRRVVSGKDGHVSALEFEDGELMDADAVVITTRFSSGVEIYASLGLTATEHPSGLGDFIATDEMGATSVPGLFAAGNVSNPSLQVLPSAAAGSQVGGMISFSLAAEDLEAAARPSANQADWDHRYSGEQMWSGNPNGTLVSEVAGLEIGRALDVGAGEGGDAIWLAEQGWKVTASDISQRALDHIDTAARQRGLSIEYLQADANALGAFADARFDLVSAQYASIPRTPDGRGIRNLLDAVAPGGSLLMVSHDLEPMRVAIDPNEHSRAFDPDAYVRVEDVVAVLAGSDDWKIEVHDKRRRPAGAASASHHVDDVVLRARRRPAQNTHAAVRGQ